MGKSASKDPSDVSLTILIVRTLKNLLPSSISYIFSLRNVHIVIDKVIGENKAEKSAEKPVSRLYECVL